MIEQIRGEGQPGGAAVHAAVAHARRQPAPLRAARGPHDPRHQPRLGAPGEGGARARAGAARGAHPPGEAGAAGRQVPILILSNISF